MNGIRNLLLALTVTTGFAGTAALAAEPDADARTKVATATNLAAIAEAEKDGDAMLVAAKMLAGSGAVAVRGEALKDGKPTLYEIGDLVMKAKEYGADAAKADAVANSATSTAKSDGYWYYSCDSYNNCQWIYGGW